MFSEIEQRADSFAVNKIRHPFAWHADIEGLLSSKNISSELKHLESLSIDGYISRVLDPAESTQRLSAKSVLQAQRGKIFNEFDLGPLYSVEIALEYQGKQRRVGIIAQNRSISNGVWGPEHHLEACRLAKDFDARSIPIITFMDTPGADAGVEANSNNQAHSISRLITVMSNAKVPTIGFIYGLGYSGGAIPLATTNVLFAVGGAVFNTIQPKGLANIARQYNLSWQESARYVGVSPCELYNRGVIDGVVDWNPESRGEAKQLIATIVTGIEAIEAAARKEVADNPLITEDYLNLISTRQTPNEQQAQLEAAADFNFRGNTTEFPNLYSHSLMYLRSLSLRSRIRSSSVDAYGRLAQEEIPEGELKVRNKALRQAGFDRWLSDPEKLIYNEDVFKAWTEFKEKHSELTVSRNRITSLLKGDPQQNYEQAKKNICFAVSLYLYNRWKSDAAFNFIEMARLIFDGRDQERPSALNISDQNITLLDLIYTPEIEEELRAEFGNLLIFDTLYDSIVNNFGQIAEESKAFQSLSEATLRTILDSSLDEASARIAGRLPGTASDDEAKNAAVNSFAKWLTHFARFKARGQFLKGVEEWKRVTFPRMSESLLVLITFFFEELVPAFMDAQLNGKPYNGKIKPGSIGKRKDFWNQLNIAYQDLLVQRVLDANKRQKLTTVDAFKGRFFETFEDTNSELMTANPVAFPGFRQSIEKSLNNGVTPCGVVTGIGRFKLDDEGENPYVGAFISNVSFQAGAFDMAGAEKLCALLLECAQQKLPVVCFVSSGGMQTKEGPSSLFSMAIANDRITRFIEATGLPVIMFGFGDCTGGSQASFVTHPLVHTYYFSGTDMPFAGRVVVPSFLPSMCTVANYLAHTPGAMQGLVKHPFAEDLDKKLREVDPSITIASHGVEEVVSKILSGTVRLGTETKASKPAQAVDFMKPMDTVLIHARGCTAVKLIRIAQKLDKNVLLVQSDPDMDSVAVDMLRDNDEVICLGGQTPDESYLNASSVVTIAARHGADALHPGIGFLSENADFARLCRNNDLNFIGPKALSMDTMGNKSNAIHTAMSNDVPVVPGSHGILTSAEATVVVAKEIGYPVLLKAVHGGGGKGIKIVRNPSEIKEAFSNVYSEARSAFGNGDLYLEKFVESMRHIEIQILRDNQGNTKVLGLRDCTVQRNNQKVLEESGSTMLPEHLEKRAYACASQLADAVDYFGAGTVEFIYDLKADDIYFMEMNTRLQVEHPVTEWTSGISIVSEQYKIAEGASIEHLKPESNGFSIEARITAEKARIDSDGVIDFIPTPGLVVECKFPEGDDIELIATVAEGKTISPFYDSMIAQLIVHGKDRNDAIDKLKAALEKTTIKGVCTNIPLLKRILNDKTFVDGEYDTNYLPTFLDTLDKDLLIEEMAYTGVSESSNDLSLLRIEGTGELKVIAPMTGIFYSTASPADPDYVKVGDSVSLSNTLCQIEAMKLFTQISLSSVPGSGEIFEANKEYKIVRINQANGAQVNAGDLLFIVKPL
jgi:acetyl/propionyl-CoA carboxylase alpha subunit/biotin carboxyl carrier protein